MSQRSSDLSQELAVLSDVFSDLGERLLHAARELHAPGSPPPEALLEELAASRRDFLGLRDRIRERSEALRVAAPADLSLDTVTGLTRLVEGVSEAESRQTEGEGLRRLALEKLDRVGRLSYAGGGEFAPLVQCQERARQLHDAIAGASWDALPQDARELGEGEHPFAHLIALVEERDALNDDHWANLHDSVGSAFGKALGAAAARAKLVPGAPPAASAAAPPPVEPKPPASPEKPPGQGRRNLGKATPSSR